MKNKRKQNKIDKENRERRNKIKKNQHSGITR